MKLAKILPMLLVASFSIAQPVEEWISTYECANDTTFHNPIVQVDDIGNVYVGAYSWTDVSSDYDITLIKYDQWGDTVWTRRYNGIGDSSDYLTAMKLDNLGNIIIGGYTWGGPTNFDMLTLKYDPLGNLLWSQIYGSFSAVDAVYAIEIDESNNVIITGASLESFVGSITTIKYNPSGIQQWIAFYSEWVPCPNNFRRRGNAIDSDSEGNIYVSGLTGDNCSDWMDHDMVTIKYDSLGNEQWVRKYAGPYGWDEATAICIDSSSNIIITGFSAAANPNQTDIVTIKYSPDGTSEWIQRYDSGNNDNPTKILTDANEDIYVGGVGLGGLPGLGSAMTVIKYASNGDSLWTRTHANSGIPQTGMVLGPDQNIYITGGENSGGGNDGYHTLRYNPNGDSIWLAVYSGVASSQSITADSQGNIYVTGEYYYIDSSGVPAVKSNILTIKYSQLEGTWVLEQESASFLINVYPNPMSSSALLSFKNENGESHVFILMNNSGQIVYEIHDITTDEIQIDKGNLDCGIYYFQLFSDKNNLGSGKLVIE